MSLRIAVLISGKGSNMLALKEACDAGGIDGRIICVVSNRSTAKGIEAARDNGTPVFIFSRNNYPKKRYFYMSQLFNSLKINFVVLAGYDELVKCPLLSDFKGRILNIHPAPLPQFGGKGMYGLEVHRAVIKSKTKISGPTIHIVDEDYDSGRTLAYEPVPVLKDDTPETLAQKVLTVEHRLYPEIVGKISRGEIGLR
ncbi:phosphoribosylglycinamide formyltransferase [candidate division WOR-3 bacterium]|nr:phosphoribosylglycinamide formyltransferase [candidate division WOR-3 bacterium]